MRRYGTLAYGVSQYGLGTVDAYAAVTVTFSENFRQTYTVPVNFTDNIVFSERLGAQSLLDVTFTDLFSFALDVRLKYVVTRMTDTIQFQLDTNTFMFAEQFAFDTLISYPIVIKSVYMDDLIAFDNAIHARRAWEPLPNPLDEIWVPRPHDGDTWIPRENEADVWVPQVSATDVWVPRVAPTDIWTPREQNNG